MFSNDNFSDVLDNYLQYAEKRHKKQGYDTLARNIKLHILPYFKDRNISDLTKKDIIEWQNIIYDKNFSNSLNNSLYIEFNGFIKYCMDYGLITKNIVSSVGNFKKKYEKKEHKVYNIHQFRKFRRCLESYIEKNFYNFMFFYGTRPSETMALRFCDINSLCVSLEHNLQRRGKRELDTPKNQSSIRKINISLLMFFRIVKLKKIYIKEYGYFDTKFYIFGGKKPLSTTTLDRHKKKACNKANLYEITQHEFRHSYATRELRKGIPIDSISKSMGHSRVTTTLDIYSHNEKRMLSIPFLNKFL